MALCLLATLWAAVRAYESPRQQRWVWLAIAASALGMASKETTVVAPVLVVLMDRAFLYSSFAHAWRARRSLYLGLAASWIVLVGLRHEPCQPGLAPTSSIIPILTEVGADRRMYLPLMAFVVRTGDYAEAVAHYQRYLMMAPSDTRAMTASRLRSRRLAGTTMRLCCSGGWWRRSPAIRRRVTTWPGRWPLRDADKKNGRRGKPLRPVGNGRESTSA